MKLPRDLSGDRLIAVLCRRWGYAQVNRVGSHAILETNQPAHQRISIPAHATLPSWHAAFDPPHGCGAQARPPGGYSRNALSTARMAALRLTMEAV